MIRCLGLYATYHGPEWCRRPLGHDGEHGPKETTDED